MMMFVIRTDWCTLSQMTTMHQPLEYLVIGNLDDSVVARTKYTLLDYDGTIVRPKDGRRFPKDPSDWEYTSDNVKSRLLHLEEDGHRLLVYTHQSKPWKREHILKSLKSLGLGCIEVFICWYNRGQALPPWSKPHRDMFDYSCKLASGIPSQLPAYTIFVGDAAGRTGDHADSDLFFAKSIGVTFKTPEEFFTWNPSWLYPDISSWCSTGPEVIVLCGSPASGKTTFSKYLVDNLDNAFAFHGDDYKSNLKKLLNDAKMAVTQGKTVIIDMTMRTRKSRDQVPSSIGAGHRIRTVYFDISKTTSLRLNQQRENRVPAIAIHSYFKHFEPLGDDESRLLSIVKVTD